MQKKIFSSLFLIVLLNLLIKPFFIFGIDAQVQNSVSTEDYGLYFSLLNLSFLFNIVLDAGINNFNAKNIAQHPNSLARYLGSIIGLRFLLGITYLIITIVAGFLLNHSEFSLHLLLLLGINQFFASFILYFRSNFAGLHRFKSDAFLSVLDRLLLIVICATLLYTNLLKESFKIEYFVYAQTAAYGISAVIAYFMTFNLAKSKVRVNKILSLAILKQSAPYALLILLMMLYSRTDAIMIERLLDDGKTQAGIYAQGFRLLDAVNIFALLFAGILLPVFARLIKHKENYKPLLKNAGQTLLTVSIAVGITASIFSEELMRLMYNKESINSALCFRWIILTFIPMSATYIFGTLLTANGSLKQLNIMACIGFVLNVILNLILIPQLKAEGAAIATLVTQVITALIQIIIAMHLLKLKVRFDTLFKLLALALALILFQFVVNTNQITSIILFGFCAIILSFVFRLINLKAIMIILKNR